jgi:tRNA guanosine-2'-O-methyltransferase
LCRTAEGFRIESVVLSNISLASSALFREVSASAYLWQPLQECALSSLPEWLEAQKMAGYTLVALQANRLATPLSDFQFPERSLLMLGRELTGIPAEVLEQCDRTVVIPQAGLVESFNVQTAAAIAMYEYACQHPLVERS